jgi:hypothetical protein
MAAGKWDIYIEAGSTFSKSFVVNQPRVLETDPLVPMDFTSWTGKAQVRKTATSAVAYEIIVTFATNRASGIVSLEMLDEVTATIPSGISKYDPKSKYVWALEMTPPNGKTVRMLEGSATVSAEVVK